MPDLALHHVSIITAELDRSIRFYADLLGLPRIGRPAFVSTGAWFACGPLQLHIILRREGPFRTAGVCRDDTHFAMRTGDIAVLLARLRSAGFREDAADDDANRMIFVPDSAAGYPQLYILDPDRNIVEINGAAS